MKVVRGRAEARWLPSRHDFALFRLAAYVRLRNAKPQESDVMMVIDRQQNAFEMYAVCAWYTLTLACFIGAVLPWTLPWRIVAALLTPALLQVPIYFVGAIVLRLMRNENHIRINSIMMMTLIFAAALYFARRPVWVRFVAWQVLAFFALNALAAAIVFLLRGRIAQLESRVGGGSAFEP